MMDSNTKRRIVRIAAWAILAWSLLSGAGYVVEGFRPGIVGPLQGLAVGGLRIMVGIATWVAAQLLIEAHERTDRQS